MGNTASKKRLNDGLTPLESRFCHEYCVDYLGGPALKRAGSKAKFADQQASEMLRKPHIATEINRIIAKQNEKVGVNKTWLMTELVLQYRAAAAAASAGNTAERRLALQALEKIGQHVDVNAFRQQLGIGNPDGTPFNYDALNDEELDDLERLLVKAAKASPDSGGFTSESGETIQ